MLCLTLCIPKGAVVSPVTLGVLFLSGCAMDLYSTFQAFQSQLQSSGSTIVTSLGTKYTPSISPAEGDAKVLIETSRVSNTTPCTALICAIPLMFSLYVLI